MLPAQDALPVALTTGWPEPLADSHVVLRESGITLGSILMDDDEWPTLRASSVYSVRIDDHPATDGWKTTEPDGTETQHEFEIPTSPVPVPPKALTSSRDLSDWVWSTHGALGRLLLWDNQRTWWIVQEPDLELTLLCGQPGLFRNESDVLSWWSLGTDKGRSEVTELCVRYGIKEP
jgi:hypothetical protein